MCSELSRLLHSRLEEETGSSNALLICYRVILRCSDQLCPELTQEGPCALVPVVNQDQNAQNVSYQEQCLAESLVVKGFLSVPSLLLVHLR